VSKKDISNFKLRKGMPIGARVTLRGDKMYEFLDRLIAVSLPRTRDFRGVPAKGFDGVGNFTLGVKEQIIFPEIDIDKVTKIQGMDITFVTTAKTDEEAKALLTAFGFPFSRQGQEITTDRTTMAKESMKARERKRAKMVEKYAAKRAAAEKPPASGKSCNNFREQQLRAHAQPLPAHGTSPRLHAFVRHQPEHVP
jgi:hypothetical protein